MQNFGTPLTYFLKTYNIKSVHSTHRKGGKKMRYYFSDNWQGNAGETPHIFSGEYDKDQLPPLDQLDSVAISFFRKDRPEESDLWLNWVTQDNILFQAIRKANDDSLKSQYSSLKEIAEKIINLIGECISDSDRGKGKNFEVKGKLEESDELSELWATIRKIRRWKEFIEPLEEAAQHLSWHFCSTINDKGYYILPVHGMIVERAIFSEEEIGWEDWFDIFLPSTYVYYFRFCPDFKIGEESVEWVLHGLELVIVLPHDDSNEKIAKKLGYLDVFNEYKARKKREEEERRIRGDEWIKRKEEEEEEKKQQLRETLSL